MSAAWSRRKWNARHVVLALAVACGCAFSGCRERAAATQTIVLIDADPAMRSETARLGLVVTSYPSGEVRLDQDVIPLEPGRSAAQPDQRAWPVSVVLKPHRGDARAQFELSVQARADDGRTLAAARVRSGFVAGRSRFATIMLSRSCSENGMEPVGASCDAGPDACPRARELAPESLADSESRSRTRSFHVCMFEEGGLPRAPLGGGDADAAGDSAMSPVEPNDAGSIDGEPLGMPDCPQGYARVGTECRDIDECAELPDACSRQRVCHNSDGSYTCDCPPQEQVANGGECLARSPCREANGGCQHECVDAPDGSHCACRPGAYAKQLEARECWEWSLAEKIEFDDAGDACEVPPNSGSLANLGSLELSVDVAGNVLAIWPQSDGALVHVRANRFDLAAGRWGESLILDAASGPAHGAKLGVDDGGNGFVSWQQSDGALYSVWGRRFDGSARVWQNAERLDRAPMQDATRPQLAVAAGGRAFVLWRQGSAPVSAWASWFDAGSERWNAPDHLETEVFGDVEDPSLGILPSAGAIAVWTQTDLLANHNVWVDVFDGPSARWTGAITIDNTTSDLRSPRLVVDPAGIATVAWLTRVGNSYEIGFNRLSGAVWGAGQASGPDSSTPPLMAADAAANVYALFLQGASRRQLYAMRFDRAAGAWSEVQSLDTPDPQSASEPQLAVNTAGRAVAIWLQDDGMRSNLWVSRYDATANIWIAPERLETMNVSGATHPRVALDAQGNALAVWAQREQTYCNIWVSRFQIDSGTWSGARRLDSENAGDASAPELRVDTSGRATVVWLQSDGARKNVWAIRLQ